MSSLLSLLGTLFKSSSHLHAYSMAQQLPSRAFYRHNNKDEAVSPGKLRPKDWVPASYHPRRRLSRPYSRRGQAEEKDRVHPSRHCTPSWVWLLTFGLSQSVGYAKIGICISFFLLFESSFFHSTTIQQRRAPSVSGDNGKYVRVGNGISR